MNITLLDVKEDFPIFRRKINGKPLVYLDSAATLQVPQVVMEKITEYLTQHNANVHRGVHTLSDEATTKYENSRRTVAKFVGANNDEIIFTRSATASLNMIARMLETSVRRRDEILVSNYEHHSNYIQWKQLAKRTGAIFKESANILEDINEKTRIVAITHMSNVTGDMFDITQITEKAHEHGAIVIVDAAQSVPHITIDVKKLKCDFLAFSGHKIGAPGIGVLYGKKVLLDNLEPVEYGGSMIKSLDTWNDTPWKFEAGTPNVVGAVALEAAIKYFQHIGMDAILTHEKELANLCRQKLKEIGATVYGKQGSIVSFNIPNAHPHDVAQVLDEQGVAIRGGHHCAQPLMKYLGVNATCRASFALYNSLEDVETLMTAIQHVKEVFS